MTHACNTPLRWKNYIINKGVNVCTFWEDHLADKARNLLFIMGQGFDPRMCNGATTILKQGEGRDTGGREGVPRGRDRLRGLQEEACGVHARPA